MKSRAYAAGAAVIGSAATAYILVGRPRQLGWGTTDEEAGATLAGDDLIPAPDLVATRAITVHAPPGQIWPWIAQLGQGRGGFYSYDALENLIGCDIRSVDRIVSEWQDVKVGDEVKLAPEVGLGVTVVEQGRALVLRGGVPIGTAPPPYDFTWAFALREQPGGDNARAGARAIRVLAVVGSAARRTCGRGQLPDDAADAARHQGPRRTGRRPSGLKRAQGPAWPRAPRISRRDPSPARSAPGNRDRRHPHDLRQDRPELTGDQLSGSWWR